MRIQYCKLPSEKNLAVGRQREQGRSWQEKASGSFSKLSHLHLNPLLALVSPVFRTASLRFPPASPLCLPASCIIFQVRFSTRGAGHSQLSWGWGAPVDVQGTSTMGYWGSVAPSPWRGSGQSQSLSRAIWPVF